MYVYIVIRTFVLHVFTSREKDKSKNVIFFIQTFLFEFVFVCKYKHTDVSHHLCQTQFYKNKFGDVNRAM